MLPPRAYRQKPMTGMTRVDLVLALFDGAIDRIDRAIELHGRGETNAALVQRTRAQMLVIQLAAGIDLAVGDPASEGLLRLYEYCAHVLAHGETAEIASARDCLVTVRDGFRGIREEAVQLERSGAIPSADGRLIEAVG